MTIIDTHAHIFPEKIAAAAAEATGRFYATAQTPTRPSLERMISHGGTAKELLACAKDAGITRLLVFSCATAAKQVDSIIDFIARECAAHEEFSGAGTMHIDYPDFEAACGKMLSLGLRGIKLHPDIQGFAVDDKRMLPLYEIMQAKGMYLICHTGDNRYQFSNPWRLKALAEQFPKMDFICAHFAGWSEWELARSLMRRENIYMDTSSTIGFSAPETAKKAFSAFDPTHIFFGSDYPMWDPKTELESILALGLPEEILEGVLHGNFEAFLARHN